jgi:hypothetical protein
VDGIRRYLQHHIGNIEALRIGSDAGRLWDATTSRAPSTSTTRMKTLTKNPRITPPLPSLRYSTTMSMLVGGKKIPPS